MKKSIALMHLLGSLVLVRGSQAQTFVWVDANGNVVAPHAVFLGTHQGFTGIWNLYIDDNGFIWRLDADSGELSDSFTIRLFLEPSCAGTPYVPAAEIRQVFRVASTAGRWIRRDTEQAHLMRFVSDDTGEVCEPINPYTTDWVVVPQPTLIAAPDEPPTLPFTPPFHLERR